MAIRKSVEEELVVAGGRDVVLDRCVRALPGRGFTQVQAAMGVGQVTGKFKKATTWGEILISAIPHSDGQTRLILRATSNVDNIFALFSSPNKRILAAAKGAIT